MSHFRLIEIIRKKLNSRLILPLQLQHQGIVALGLCMHSENSLSSSSENKIGAWNPSFYSFFHSQKYYIFSTMSKSSSSSLKTSSNNRSIKVLRHMLNESSHVIFWNHQGTVSYRSCLRTIGG